MKKLLVISSFVLLFASQFATAQQDPQYTQYMYNMSVVNPAYAGIKENLNVGVLYRDQWSGFRGAPKTFTFFAHSPVGEKTGLGLSAIADENGPVKETNVYADFSYRLDLGAYITLVNHNYLGGIQVSALRCCFHTHSKSKGNICNRIYYYSNIIRCIFCDSSQMALQHMVAIQKCLLTIRLYPYLVLCVLAQ